MTRSNFTSRLDSRDESDSDDDIQSLIRENLEDIKHSEPGIADLAIGVLNQFGGINWVYSLKSSDKEQISILLLSLMEIDNQGVAALTIDNVLLPVLAVAL
jgi:hypothetical protein